MAESNALLNALADVNTADLFLDILDAQDLSILLPIVAQVNRNKYELLFMRTLRKTFSMTGPPDRLRASVTRVPDDFKKIYPRIAPVHAAASWSGPYMYNWNCTKIFGLYNDGIKHSESPGYQVSGSIVYACRTGWIVIYANEIPIIEEKHIADALQHGYSIAIDPNTMIIQVSKCKPSEQLTTHSYCYRADDILTSFFRIPKIVAYRGKGCFTKRVLLYLHSDIPADVHRAVAILNEKLFVSYICDNYVTLCLPGSNAYEFIPYLFYGNSVSLPDHIYYPPLDQNVWDKSKPIFREYPPLT